MSNQTKDGANSTEKKNGHTQGEWKAENTEFSEYSIRTKEMDIATVWCLCMPDEEAEANAKLIAQAPQLYAALQVIRAHVEHTETDYTDGKIFVPKTDLLKYIDSFLNQ